MKKLFFIIIPASLLMACGKTAKPAEDQGEDALSFAILYERYDGDTVLIADNFISNLKVDFTNDTVWYIKSNEDAYYGYELTFSDGEWYDEYDQLVTLEEREFYTGYFVDFELIQEPHRFFLTKNAEGLYEGDFRCYGGNGGFWTHFHFLQQDL